MCRKLEHPATGIVTVNWSRMGQIGIRLLIALPLDQKRMRCRKLEHPATGIVTVNWVRMGQTLDTIAFRSE